MKQYQKTINFTLGIFTALFAAIFSTPQVFATTTTLSPTSFGYAQYANNGANLSWETLMTSNPNLLYPSNIPQTYFKQGSTGYDGYRRGYFCFDTSSVPAGEEISSVTLTGINKCLNVNCQNFPQVEREPLLISLRNKVNYENELNRINFENSIGTNTPYFSSGSSGAYTTNISNTWIKRANQCFAILSYSDFTISTPIYWNTLHNTYSVEFDTNPTLTIVSVPPPTPTPSPLPGDANNDTIVDENDYVIWYNNFLLENSGPDSGDFNNDGIVDGMDYITWLNNYGT